jgi:hypothetical protein
MTSKVLPLAGKVELWLPGWGRGQSAAAFCGGGTGEDETRLKGDSMKKNNAAEVWGVSYVRSGVVVLAAVLLGGCAGGEGFFAEHFPKDLVERARSQFETDMSAWHVPQDATIPGRMGLVVSAEAPIESDFRDFCELTILRNLRGHGFEVAPNARAELVVCMVRVSEIRKPVRGAKVRLAISVRRAESEEAVLLGICDGIMRRPDLARGDAMPESSYLSAAHQAIVRLMQQICIMPRTT